MKMNERRKAKQYKYLIKKLKYTFFFLKVDVYYGPSMAIILCIMVS